MGTEYCGLIATAEDRQECQAAVAYITAVVEHDCAVGESEFCVSFHESHDFTSFFFSMPQQIQDDLAETFVNAFGFERSEMPTVFDSMMRLQGLPPHSIFSPEPDVNNLPSAWNQEDISFEWENEETKNIPLYRPAGWGTLVDVSLDGLAFRGSDGIDARVATRLSVAHYFDIQLFISGGFEFATTFTENAGVFNFDLAIEGGYYLPLSDHFGFEFFAGLNLGYLMSNGAVTDDEGRPVGISTFDAGVGGGVRAMIPLVDEPVKSNIPFFSIGVEYSRRLNCDLLPPDQLFISTGFLFNYV